MRSARQRPPVAELADFGAARERTLAMLDGLSEEEMARRPGPERWSAGELADHLLRTELLWRHEIEELVTLARAGRRPYLNRLLTDLPLPGVELLPPRLLTLASVPLTFASAFVPNFFLESFLRWRTIPAQAPPSIAPRAGRPPETLRHELAEQREATEAVFRDHADLDFRRMVYHHPLLGLSDPIGLLRVITVHERRHQRQLAEILAAIGVGGAASVPPHRSKY